VGFDTLETRRRVLVMILSVDFFFEQFDRPSLVCFRGVLKLGDGEFPGLHVVPYPRP
jgi:hypothetical protein